MKSKSTLLPQKPRRPSSKPSRPARQSSSGTEPSTNGPIPWEPAPYQLDAAKFLVQNGSAGLFLDPGLRKTSIMLAAFKVLRKRRFARSMLVVAPPQVCAITWAEEVAKWADFNDLKVVNLTGPKKESLLDAGADIYMLSFAQLPWFFQCEKLVSAKSGKVKVTLGFDNLRRIDANILAIDEISKARNTNSLTFKILKEAREKVDRVYGATGTFSPKSLMDLYGIMYLIDGGYSLGAYITHYRREYFYPTGYGGFTYELKDDGFDRIMKAIERFTYRLDPKDYVKLPELVENVVKVVLPPDARKVYDEIEDDFFTEIDEVGVAALNGGVAHGKCKQVVGGGLYDAVKVDEETGIPIKGKRDWFLLHGAKVEAVQDLFEELNGQQLMVAYWYGHDLEQLRKAFPKAPVFGGGTTDAARKKIVTNWNAGKTPLLLVHPGSMSHGLNMQGSNACHIAWFSLVEDREQYDQTIARLRRSGNQASTVFSHLIVAKDTVDEITLRRSSKKDRTQKAVGQALAEYTLRRRRALRLAKVRK